MKRKLSELSRQQYDSLRSSGMMYEIYPEATGNWFDDNGCEHKDNKIETNAFPYGHDLRVCSNCGKVLDVM